MLVRTPWLLDKLRSADPSLNAGDFFIAEKGVGKGDIPSPLLWYAAFDIPLTALAAIDGGFNVQDMESQAVSCNDIAFADDLVSIVASLKFFRAKLT